MDLVEEYLEILKQQHQLETINNLDPILNIFLDDTLNDIWMELTNDQKDTIIRMRYNEINSPMYFIKKTKADPHTTWRNPRWFWAVFYKNSTDTYFLTTHHFYRDAKIALNIFRCCDRNVEGAREKVKNGVFVYCGVTYKVNL